MKKTYILLAILAILLINLPVKADNEISIPYAEMQINSQPNVIEYDLSDSHIVYTTEKDNNYTLYLYDLNKDKITTIAQQEGSKFQPSIDNENLVYVQNNKDIVLYNFEINADLEEKITERITTSYPYENNVNPHIQDNKISYTRWFYNQDKSMCQVYDLVTKENKACESIIGHHQTNQNHHNDKVVWQDDRSGLNNIYLQDFTTNEIQNLSDNGLNHYFPKVYNDIVIWDTKNQIYVKNLADKSLQIISNDQAAIFSSDIDNQNIVYQSNPGGNYDIFLYNLITRDQIPVTFSLAEDKSPKISGNHILWLRYNTAGQYDLFYKNIKPYTDKLFTQLTLETIDSSSVQISWPETNTANQYYTLYRSELTGSIGKAIADHIKNDNYTDDTIAANKDYYYTLRLVDINGDQSTLTQQYPYHSANWRLVKTNTSSTVYLVDYDQSWLISDVNIFNAHNFKWTDIVTITKTELDQYHYAGPLKYPEGSLIQSNSKAVYLVVDGQIQPFSNEATFKKGGFKWNQIHYVLQNHLRLYPINEPLTLEDF
ncbi:MAG: hypothetical protein ABH884_03300 [Candidatus Komeilibacteria bacterium]